jgi:hypothetical protein
MPILITGHRGFIGQNMMAALPDAVGYEWGDGPLSLDGIDRVIHLGAISSTACNDLRQIADPERGLYIRPAGPLRGTRNTLAVCFIRICLRSQGQDLPRGRPCGALQPLRPNQARHRGVHPITRLAHAGAGVSLLQRLRAARGPQRSAIAVFLCSKRQAADTGKIVVFAGSESICRDFVPVERVIEVHKRFFDLPVTGVYNIGTGKAVSFMDVARTVALETDAEIVTVPMPYIPSYQRFTQADMAKTHSLL